MVYCQSSGLYIGSATNPNLSNSVFIFPHSKGTLLHGGVPYLPVPRLHSLIALVAMDEWM